MIGLAGLALAAGAAGSGRMVGYFENRLYQDDIIFAQTTPYQRVTVTRGGDRWRLFLNGSLQFDSYDERRYHEALVHPVMRRAPRRGEVLILGGGDGLATREVLRWPDAARVTLVDIDPAVTEAFRDLPALAALNDHAFSDPRVTIVNGDAWAHLRESGKGEVALACAGRLPLQPRSRPGAAHHAAA